VASSNINIFGYFINDLAIAILYFYPPDKFELFSLTFVFNPSGNYFLSNKKSK